MYVVNVQLRGMNTITNTNAEIQVLLGDLFQEIPLHGLHIYSPYPFSFLLVGLGFA